MGTCQSWPIDTTCLPDDWPANPTGWSPEQTRAVARAQEELDAATAYQFGLCTVTVRPCNTRKCRPLLGAPTWQPIITGGELRNIMCGCVGVCCCAPPCQVDLRDVVYGDNVTTVKVDGATLPSTAYRLDKDSPRMLVRIDGDCWPDCQRLDQPDSEPDTWSVTYLRGTPVPLEGRAALAVLAVELWRACIGMPCRLPGNVVTVSRQGIDITYKLNPGEFGVKELDDFVDRYNPGHSRAMPLVLSPDRMPWRRTG